MNGQIWFGMTKKKTIWKTICGNLKLYWFSMFHRLWWKTFARYAGIRQIAEFRKMDQRKWTKGIEENAIRFWMVFWIGMCLASIGTIHCDKKSFPISNFQYCLMSTSTYINSFYFWKKKLVFLLHWHGGTEMFLGSFLWYRSEHLMKICECKRFSSLNRTVIEFEKIDQC